MNRLTLILGSALACPALASTGQSAEPGAPLEEIVVTATLREQSLQSAPVSATVLTATTLQDAGQQHFEDVLSLAPNLNWAAGTSRPRYFQIRGVGEREQYEGAPNPSVGFLIDDMDFSGLGMPATLFDVRQIEILRGPQGTRYGANALAGLIAVRSAEPSDTYEFGIEGSAAEYGTGSLGFVASGPASSLDSAWRLAVQRYRSDGFRDNVHLGRSTSDRDELTARLKWRWQPSDLTQVDFTLLHADLANGYDAWSIDNSRRTLSDRPGEDSQRASGGSVRWTSSLWTPATLTVIAAAVNSKSTHGFDGDWGNAQSWAPFVYDFYYRGERERESRSLEVRLASSSPEAGAGVGWLVGAYALDLREGLSDINVGTLIDPDPVFGYTYELDDALTGRYRADNIAVFGQLDGRLASRWRWSLGLRSERRQADYRDSGIVEGAPRAVDLSATDDMLGGQASLSFELSSATTLYAAVSRGYKAGGFNLGNVPQDRLEFSPEYLWNLETGMKWAGLEGRLFMDATLFYEWRRNLQIRTGEQLRAGDPSSYVFFTDNASRGYNYGLESSLRWRAAEQLELGGSLGLLSTRYIGYRPDETMIADREQAHAPEYQVSAHAVWRHPAGWMARIDVSAVDDFYFDVPPNDSRAGAYSLTHLKLGYEAERWAAYLWGRNVFDERYANRGFFFGNEPPDFPDKLYVQLGDPRQIGVSFNYSFR